MAKGYSMYLLNDTSVERLIKAVKPQNEIISCHHITNVWDSLEEPLLAPVRAWGYLSVPGMDIWLCAVGGSFLRPVEGVYHITHSYDPNRYKPADANHIIETALAIKVKPIHIELTATPTVVQF